MAVGEQIWEDHKYNESHKLKEPNLHMMQWAHSCQSAHDAVGACQPTHTASARQSDHVREQQVLGNVVPSENKLKEPTQLPAQASLFPPPTQS